MAHLTERTIGALNRDIRKLKGRIGQDVYALGELLCHIRDEQRYKEAGHRSFSQYLAAVDISRSQASRLVDIYTHFSAEIARRYGIDKLEAGVAYLRATPEDERPGDLIAADLRLRDERGEELVKPFHEATADEIRAARRLVEEAKDAARPISAGVRAWSAGLEAFLPAAASRMRTGRRVRLRHDATDDRLYATFTAIPLDQIDAFARALLAHPPSA